MENSKSDIYSSGSDNQIVRKNLEKILELISPFFNGYNAQVEKTRTALLKQYHTAGKIIGCHSLLEHFIKQEAVRNNIKEENYAKRIELLYKTNSKDENFYKALDNFRKIRNEVAHNFTVEIDTLDTADLDSFLAVVEIEAVDPIAKIEKFTDFCIMVFSFYVEEMHALKEEIFTLENNILRIKNKS